MTDRVSIVITTWETKAKPYLDLLIESVHNLDYPKELLDVILVGRKSYAPTYDGVLTVSPDSDNFPCPMGMNYGVARTNPESKYLFYMNDDVILSKNCLKNLIGEVGDNDVIANGISPCDNGMSYGLIFGFIKDEKFNFFDGNQFRLHDIKGFEKDLMNADSFYPAGWIKQNFLCFYATFIPRKCWNKIGPMDENYWAGPDDIDYSYRALQHGIQPIAVLNSLIWHFGGVTTTEGSSFDRRKANAHYFYKKWGNWPPMTADELKEGI